MGWGTSILGGVKALANGAVWTVSGALNMTANTVSFLWKGGQAFGDAAHTLIHNPAANPIAKKMVYMAVFDVVPLVTIYYTNKLVQTYISPTKSEQERQVEEQQNVTLGLMTYSTFSNLLSLVKDGARYYEYSRGIQSAARMLVLESRAAPAFNSNKTTPPNSLCTALKCNAKRELKGLAREPIILLGNELLSWTISNYVPYGYYPAQLLKILIYGRYITRQVTPERCERHKEMVLESVLALGLGYYANIKLLDWMFEQTIGMPPTLTYRTLSRLLLLLHVNLAAHMTIPIRPENTPWYRDPLNSYERITRFIADVLHAGLKSRIPKDFNFSAAKPILPLSVVLQSSTWLLNRDLPKIDNVKQPAPNNDKPKEPGYFSIALEFIKKKAAGPIKKAGDIARATTDAAWYFAVPPILRGVNGFIKDPIVSDHWIVIRDGVISGIEIINGIGRTGKVTAPLVGKAAVWAPDSTAVVLNLKWGIPKVVTKVGLKLSRKEDFWELARALKLWMLRHNIECVVELDEPSGVPMNGEKELIPLPAPSADAPPPIPAPLLENAEQPPIPPRQLDTASLDAIPMLTPDQLAPIETGPPVSIPSPVPADLVMPTVPSSAARVELLELETRVDRKDPAADPVAKIALDDIPILGVADLQSAIMAEDFYVAPPKVVPNSNRFFEARRRTPNDSTSAGMSLAYN